VDPAFQMGSNCPTLFGTDPLFEIKVGMYTAVGKSYAVDYRGCDLNRKKYLLMEMQKFAAYTQLRK
jgi:hypothetical protein